MSSLPTELDFARDRRATPDRMNLAMDYLVARLKAVESLAPGIQNAIETLNTIGLDRISATLVPLAEQAAGVVSDLAAIKATWESDDTFDNAVAATTSAVVDAFADYRHRYLGAKDGVPAERDDGTAVDIGDMYFDTTLDSMRVLGSAGWKNAGSSVAGILNQFAPITATAGQTVFTIPGGYDPGYLIVTVNGIVVLNYTATDGTTVSFASGLTVGDKVGGIAFGAVTISSVYSKAQADAAFAVIGAAYTKAEADGKFALATAAYDKSTSDSRYARNDLSNLTDAAAARSNLGVGTAGTRADGYFLRVSNALSDIVPGTARTNLGLGTAAVQADTYFLKSASNLSDLASASTARANLGLKTAATVNLAVGTTAPSSPATGDLWVDTN